MTELNGFQIYDFFKSGTANLVKSRVYIDKINVFPVPDGDTGTNLSSTLIGAIEDVQPVESASDTLKSIADAALVSARGNSGAIFAQFIAGLSDAVNKGRMHTLDFILAVEKASQKVRQSIAEPREGTILSVMDVWSKALLRSKDKNHSFDELLVSAKDDLQKSLLQTKFQMDVLRKSNVVDAGASGFVEFIEGAHAYIKTSIPSEFSLVQDDFNTSSFNEPDHSHDEKPNIRFCTELILTGKDLSTEEIRNELKDLGTSLIVIGNSSRVRVHIHTDHPELIMQVLGKLGTITKQKADDMILQFEDIHERVSDIAIVTDSSCDLSPELIKKYHIHVIPLFLNTGSSEYLDKLTLSSSEFWRIAEEGTTLPKTSQPSEMVFKRMYSMLLDQYKTVISIHLSSKLSGTYAASLKEAQKNNKDRILVFDSKHLSGSLGLVVLRAAEAIEDKMPIEELAKNIPAWCNKANNFVSVSSLRYMVKGGRVSPLKGLLAKLLNLKPIVSVDREGKSLLYGKTFSEKSNIKKIVKMVKEIHTNQPLKYYAIVYSQENEKSRNCQSLLEAELGFSPLYTMEISSVVALNAGKGAVSVVTMSE